MLRTSLLAAGAVLAFALPLHAQVPIRVGQTVRGELSATDPKADDDSHYDLYTFRARQGERVTFTLRSSAFDAYLAVGRMEGGEFDQIESDDDGAGGTDARVTITFSEAGDYVVRANSLGAGETGAYTLMAEAGGEEEDDEDESTPAAVAAPIRMGQTVSGALAASDPKMGDGSYFDHFSFTGRRGDRVEVVMRSTAFDSHLSVGQLNGTELNVLESDDDGAGGNDARVRLTLPEDGQYVIRANSVEGGETGAYTIALRPFTPPPAPRPQAIRAGQTVSGQLSDSDAQADDDSYYDAFVYEGRAGEKLRITMRSPDFDAFLSIGQGTGEAFESIQTDDDEGGGTDAKIEITLPRTGTYVIRANTLGGGETGAYTLIVERL
ncbi:MAG TPA: PPC domain-containing protein [Longimicrobium sp.]|jgi:plastocyanin